MSASVLSPEEHATREVVTLLAALGLVDESRGSVLRSAFLNEDPGGGRAEFLECLVRAGVLTRFQADRILEGESQRLIVGPYVLRSTIGPSTLGTLYRADRKNGTQAFAVLVLPLRSIWNAHLAKKQVDVFSTLPKHPGIAPVVDIDTANGMHYLAWPFTEGDTLADRLARKGPLAPAVGGRFLADLAELLALCHRHGLAHGTLRPAVVQLTTDGKPRLLELGVGTILAENIVSDDSFLDTVSTANAAAQTIDCSAPETTQDPTLRTPAADQYSLGCLAYFALTGAYPFPSGSVVDTMIAHATRTPAPLSVKHPEIPIELSNAVDRLLRKTPGDRFPDMATAATALAGAALLCPSSPLSPSGETLPRIETLPSSQFIAPRQKDFLAPKSGAEMNGAVNFEMPPVEPGAEPSTGRLQRLDRTALRFLPPQPVALTPAPKPTSIPPIVKPIPLTGSKSGPGGPKPPPEKRKELSDANISIDLPAPVEWTSAPIDLAVGEVALRGQATVPVLPRRTPALFRFFRRVVLFWKPSTEVVQLSLFGPTRLVPGQAAKFQAYTHPPATFAGVRTLARAFLPDADLIASGYLDWEICRGRTISLHLAVSNAGVSEPLVTFAWLGQTLPRTFDVFVPWECPAGLTSAALSADVDGIRAAGVRFHIEIVPRIT